jgi:hypothetical protein
MKTIWTLVNESRTFCTGIFLRREDAVDFAEKHVPGMGLTPIELMLKVTTFDGIMEFTWDKDTSFDTPLAFKES